MITRKQELLDTIDRLKDALENAEGDVSGSIMCDMRSTDGDDFEEISDLKSRRPSTSRGATKTIPMRKKWLKQVAVIKEEFDRLESESKRLDRKKAKWYKGMKEDLGLDEDQEL